MAFAFINLMTIAQTQKLSVTGKVTDAQTQAALPSATVTLNNRTIVADETGSFTFTRLSKGIYELKVSEIGYADQIQKINLTQSGLSVTIQMKSVQLFLQPLEVKALRANAAAPFAKTNMNKEDIAKNNLGQDLPFILNQTPSIYVSSDAGTGVGYTYLHIRGTDATRINVGNHGNKLDPFGIKRLFCGLIGTGRTNIDKRGIDLRVFLKGFCERGINSNIIQLTSPVNLFLLAFFRRVNKSLHRQRPVYQKVELSHPPCSIHSSNTANDDRSCILIC